MPHHAGHSPRKDKAERARGALQAAGANSRASRGKALIPVRRRVTVLPAMSRENISSRNSARVFVLAGFLAKTIPNNAVAESHRTFLTEESRNLALPVRLQ